MLATFHDFLLSKAKQGPAFCDPPGNVFYTSPKGGRGSSDKIERLKRLKLSLWIGQEFHKNQRILWYFALILSKVSAAMASRVWRSWNHWLKATASWTQRSCLILVVVAGEHQESVCATCAHVCSMLRPRQDFAKRLEAKFGKSSAYEVEAVDQARDLNCDIQCFVLSE